MHTALPEEPDHLSLRYHRRKRGRQIYWGGKEIVEIASLYCSRGED
jgi:hypothetical protein